MPQKLIDIKGSEVGQSILLDDIGDVTLDPSTLVDKSLLNYEESSGEWKNVTLEFITDLAVRRTLVKTTDFTAAPDFNYIIDVTSGPIQTTLPKDPPKGTVILFIDRYSSSLEYNCFKGFSNNPLTIKCPLGYSIEQATSLMMSISGSFIELMYVGCETWRIMNTNDPYKLFRRARQTPVISVSTYTLQYSDWGKTLIFQPLLSNSPQRLNFIIPNISVPLGWWCEFEVDYGEVKIETAEILNARGRYLRLANTTIRLVYTDRGWRASGPLNES